MREFFLKLAVARGEIEADLLIQNVQLVNVLSGEIYREDVAVFDGRVVGFGPYDAKEVVDAEGLYLAPGFIDGHIHFESTMLTLPEFARAVLPHGTTAAVIDPHEITNVLGLDGIRYVLNYLTTTPLDMFVMLPSCVPATPLETSGAVISNKELNFMIYEEKVAGIGEMMNFPAVVSGDDETHWRIKAAKWKKVDGHAPGVSGKPLNAYILSNIDSDHESTTAAEALEKLRKGMHILVREGTCARNLASIIPIINRENSFGFSFSTDDKHPIDLVEEGHIDFAIRKAISLGMDPLIAYQMATIHTSRHYNLKNIGAIKPRYWADFVLLSDLKKVTIERVYKKGAPVFDKGHLNWQYSAVPQMVRSTMNPGDVELENLKIPAETGRIRVIGIVPGQILTESLILEPSVCNGEVVSDVDRDILKIVVIERHKATGRMGKGFVRGLGLKHGAIGSSIAHDSHNLVIVGTSDEDIFAAFKHLRKTKGGLVVVDRGQVIADLPLSIAGLLSDRPYEEVVTQYRSLQKAASYLGSYHHDPFLILSFLSLSPVPDLKITDLGLIDVGKFHVVPLFVD